MGTLQGRETFNPETKSYPGRSLDSRSDQTREREIEKLIHEYENDPKTKDDVLGIIILNVLKRGRKYKEVIEFHCKAINNGLMHYERINDNDDESAKLYKLGTLFCILGQHDKSIKYFEEILKTVRTDLGDNHPLIAKT